MCREPLQVQISVCQRGRARSARVRTAVKSQTPDSHILPAPAARRRRRRRRALDDETRGQDCTIPQPASLQVLGGGSETRLQGEAANSSKFAEG